MLVKFKFFLCGLAILFLSFSALASEPAAIITKVLGEAIVLSKINTSLPAKKKMFLTTDDTIITGKDSSVSVLLRGEWEPVKISENSKWTIKDGIASFQNIETKDITSSSDHAAVITRGHGDLAWLKLPEQVFVSDEVLSLNWQGAGLPSEAMLVIRNNTHETVFKDFVHNAHFALRLDKEFFKPQESYQWELEFNDGEVENGLFSLLNADEEKELKSKLEVIDDNDEFGQLKRIIIYFDAGLYQEAGALVLKLDDFETEQKWLDLLYDKLKGRD